MSSDQEMEKPVDRAKSNKIADKFINQGHESFRQGKMFKALVAFNKSLCFAEPESKTVGRIYADRCQVYSETKMYPEALANLNLAQEFSDSNDEFDELEVMCQEAMKTSQTIETFNIKNFFKLSHPANIKIPFIIDSLEVRQNEKFGRYVITRSDLHTGDIIAIEETFFKTIDPRSRFERCNFCLKMKRLNLIPCLRCSKGL